MREFDLVFNYMFKQIVIRANTILIVTDDGGNAVGVKNVKETCLSIENSINDNIDPIPTYTLDVNEKTKVILKSLFSKF